MPLLLKKVIFLTLFLFLTGEAYSLSLASPDAKAEKKGAVRLPPANETLTYDAAGNRQSNAQWDYGWDSKNQLIRARTKNHTTAPHAYDLTYTYDAEGRRVKKHVLEYQNGAVTSEKIITFLWDDWDLLYERHQMPSGLTLLERKYLWGPDIADGEAGGAGGLLLISETRGTTTNNLIPLYDGTGHVIALTDIEKNLHAQYTYGPFGEKITATGSKANTNPWRWATKYLDEETGLYYFGHRYYDPITGQWLSREQLGEEESLNLYSYCHNDPVNKVDVQGLEERVIANAEPKLFITGNTADGNYIGWATEKDGMFQAFQPTGNFYYQGPFTESQAREIQTNGGRLDLRRKGASLAFKSEQLQDSIHRLEVAKFYVANTAQAAAGVGEAAAGVVAAPVTVGVSSMAVVHGADVTSTALMRMWNGPGIDTQSNTSLAFQAIGFDRNTAEYGDTAMSFVVPAAQVTNLVMKAPVSLSQLYSHPVKIVQPARSVFEVGEIMPNGQVAGMGPGAACSIRVRHFTSNSGLSGIRESDVIIASDKNMVFTVRAKGTPGAARDVEALLGIKRGRGNAYVEFDAIPEEIIVTKNPLTGATEYNFKGNVDLSSRNPQFFKNR